MNFCLALALEIADFSITLTAKSCFVSVFTASKTLAKPPLPRSRPLEYLLIELSPFGCVIFSSIMVGFDCLGLEIGEELWDERSWIRDV